MVDAEDAVEFQVTCQLSDLNQRIEMVCESFGARELMIK
jgi:hypothetical protein